MLLKREATLREKLEQVKELLENSNSLSAMTEGSKVIIMVVNPKEESKAINELSRTYKGKILSVSCAEQVIKTANDYGYEQLRENLESFGEVTLDDFSKRVKDKIVEEILRVSKTSDIRVVVLHRLGILNGITRLSPIIEGVAGKLRNPLLVIYPGKREGHTLTFLNSRHKTSIYRAAII
ncbi:MAG TPA: hypothetical protein DHV12_07185 [Thermotogae bacterium]|nr:hypothetical protein [Thermotogota bacterium]